MRWDRQQVEREDRERLPGYNDGAVVRRFDAPEALDMRFYEVRAKSALNKVPGAARHLPFSWTVNPYRGCSHACTYCAAGDTPILMADGRTRPLAELSVGDATVGTERRGDYRRYVTTKVLDHWSSVKPAYRVTLADGTELVASGDHRFLSERGWKHVTGAMAGPGQRPYLTCGNALLGTGRFATGPEQGPDYRQGYLCGIIRGDGYLSATAYERSRRWVHYDFRLALVDTEALERSSAYLLELEVATTAYVFQKAAVGYREMRAVRTQSRDAVERVRELIVWPLSPSDEWRKGFLAGIFDAEGSCTSGSALRIANTDPVILGWTAACLGHFGFDAVVEGPQRENGPKAVRLRGGLREQLRFFHTVDPAITRKRTVQGRALKSDADTRVVSIEPLPGAMRLYDITTGTGDFIANGVVSHNCFARPTHEYLEFDAGRDFEREIVVKVNVPEVLRAELARPSWKGESVAMGTNTDPYQWVEGRYKLMRGIWEALRDAANPCSVLTKSPLILRDLDLLREVAARTRVTAALSVPTLEEKAWRATEPHTPHPRARLEAVAELNRQGIPTGILIAPLMPGINDAPEQVEEIIAQATEAGATSIGGNVLFLRGKVRDVFFDWLRAARPDLVPRYEELYRGRAYLSEAQRAEIESAAGLSRRRLRPFPERFRHRTGGGQGFPAAPNPSAARGGPAASDGPAREQGTLF